PQQAPPEGLRSLGPGLHR
ncbi:hypothetical protein BN1708_019206, partial [Verticillium longisporum]